MEEEYIGKHEIGVERPRYKVTKTETKKVSMMVYLLGMTIAACGIIIPTGIIIKAGFVGLMSFLRKLRKRGLFDETEDIKQMLDNDLISRKVLELYDRHMEKTHPSMSDDYIQNDASREIEEWNNVELWYKNHNVVTYPTKKEL